jgi:hypothetical protein
MATNYNTPSNKPQIRGRSVSLDGEATDVEIPNGAGTVVLRATSAGATFTLDNTANEGQIIYLIAGSDGVGSVNDIRIKCRAARMDSALGYVASSSSAEWAPFDITYANGSVQHLVVTAVAMRTTGATSGSIEWHFSQGYDAQ